MSLRLALFKNVINASIMFTKFWASPDLTALWRIIFQQLGLVRNMDLGFGVFLFLVKDLGFGVGD